MTKSFFKFEFPTIISKGKITDNNVTLYGIRKNNLICRVAFTDVNPIGKTNAQNSAEPKDTVYLLLIEVAF